jgi:hypothetical protein
MKGMTWAALFALGFAGVAAISPASGAGTQRFTSAVTPLLDGAAGKSLGSLGPGAALDVVGQSGSATHVTLHGWSAQGSGAIVFTFPDEHIVELTGFTGHATASNALVDDIQTVWKSASALYSQKCSSCHALQPVTSYSANQWPAIMKTQAGNAGLDPAETALITTYLQVQSGK